ncbi:MAG: glycine cleavage system aminomethyltransferase GcvT [Nanoarchaeota archaeon]
MTQVNNNLKSTPLLNEHIKLGAVMVPFGGWYMPVQYTNVIDEHLTTRTRVGIFDTCHMGEFIVTGEKAEEFLQNIVTNDISRLDTNQACYNCLCYENGTVIDDLFVYKLKNGEFFVVVNASTIEKDFNWFLKHRIGDVSLRNISDETAKIDIQGPCAQATIQKLTDYNLESIERFGCEKIIFKGFNEEILISRTGYTGEDGFEIYFSPGYASLLWNKILEAGREFGIKPCGLGARDTLRLEACYSLYGHEINEELTPIEAGLGFAVKFNKDFIGRNVLEFQKNNGTERKLICFEMLEKSVPREKYEITLDHEKVGFVSSGTFSPTFKKGLGMGYIRSNLADIGKEISILIRGKEYKGVIVARPFYKYRGGN